MISFNRTATGAFTLIVAEFDFRISIGTGRADGLGFTLLNTANYGFKGVPFPDAPWFVAEEPNFTGSLGVGFDTYLSSDIGDISNNHLSLHFNGASIGQFDLPPGLDLASGQWIHARIIMRPGGGHSDVSVILTESGSAPVTVINRFKVTGFTPYEGRVYLGARSGGLTSDHDIDNICVNFLNSPTQFKSGGAQDGWVLESSEFSKQGGTINAADATFILGDNAGNRQYRSILSFNTASLPDEAIITKVVLKIKKQNVTGTNPFATHKNIAIDIRRGGFSKSAILQPTDFQALAQKPAVGLIVNHPTASGWYSAKLNSAAFPYINPTGVTQLRLRFQTDDDNDTIADFIRFYSGNSTAANRPVLVIEYSVP